MIEKDIPHVALAGNPNCGKSTIFNSLTGLRQKVANYPGVTVEKKEGLLRTEEMGDVHVIDLPGTYSLSHRSLDEKISHDVLLGLQADTPAPQLIIAVVDASNLERNLFFASQLLSLGKPVILALNMMDLAYAAGFRIQVDLLSQRLGVPVISMSAHRGQGLTELRDAIVQQLRAPTLPRSEPQFPEPIDRWSREWAKKIAVTSEIKTPSSMGELLRMLSSDLALEDYSRNLNGSALTQEIVSARRQLEAQGISWSSLEADCRYRWIEQLLAECSRKEAASTQVSDRIDRVLTHRIFGPAILVLILLAIFTSIFQFAQIPMDGIDALFGWLSSVITDLLPAGPLRSLLTEGIIAGVGSVLIFLPQILFLFFFLGILEDTGYMARVAFILDRVMGKVGLHGKAFIPLLSSFACAIPGIMATRTIESAKDRLVTILVAPFMCCSARWPVYFLLAGAFIPNVLVLGFLPLPAVVIFSMVLFGVIMALLMAALFKKTILKGATPPLILELPPYRVPRFRAIVRHMLERGWLFVKNAGTIILAISIVLWALASYPRRERLPPDVQIQQSYAGQIGHLFEPVLQPLGFDWKIGVAIVASFAAREVFVSSMGTIYGVSDADEEVQNLKSRLQQELDPQTGTAFFTPLRAISLMVFYVLAMQCMSTLAIVRRETNSWKWALFQLGYMTLLAWFASFAVWQGGRLLGFG